MASACDHVLPLCAQTAAVYQANPGDTRAFCVQGIQNNAADVAGTTGRTVDDVIQQYVACLNASQQCFDVKACDPHLPQSPKCQGDDCGDEPGEYTLADGGPKLDAAKPDVHTPAPGDDINCVVCAEKSCLAESALCFLEAYDLPGCAPNAKLISDCCVEYRTCMEGCVNPDPVEEAKCVVGFCQVSLPTGAAQFDVYAKCMNAKCANCGSTP